MNGTNGTPEVVVKVEACSGNLRPFRGIAYVAEVQANRQVVLRFLGRTGYTSSKAVAQRGAEILGRGHLMSESLSARGGDAECEGHPAGPFDTMGETVYCDGSCKKVAR